MGKTLTLEQLSRKVYVEINGLPDTIKATIGDIDDAWDAIIYGPSGTGKTNFITYLIKCLVKAMACRVEYISYEEGHSKTLKKNMFERNNLLAEIGNFVSVTDHLTYEELDTRMGKRRSPKIWVFDSIQASYLTLEHFYALKRKYVLSNKKKIFIYISWSEGKNPLGIIAKSVHYLAPIKLRAEGFIVFPMSRYGGNKPFVIYEEKAMEYWGNQYYKKAQIPKPKIKKEAKHGA